MMNREVLKIVKVSKNLFILNQSEDYFFKIFFVFLGHNFDFENL